MEATKNVRKISYYKNMKNVVEMPSNINKIFMIQFNDYMEVEFPHILKENEEKANSWYSFIEKRVNSAMETYFFVLGDDLKNHQRAKEIARKQLFSGYEFSPLSIMDEATEYNYERSEHAEMYFKCEDLFEDVYIHDDYDDSTNEHYDLIEKIQKRLEYTPTRSTFNCW